MEEFLARYRFILQIQLRQGLYASLIVHSATYARFHILLLHIRVERLTKLVLK